MVEVTSIMLRSSTCSILLARMVVALATLGAAAPTAHAAMITLGATGSGSDGSLAASATFTTSSGQLQIVLSNTLAANAIRSAGQALSDISFTLSNAPGTVGTMTASGQLANVASDGTTTNVSGAPVRWIGQGPPPPGGQGTFSITGNTILMESLGGGQPSQMILPGGGTYTNVNNGFSNFNPYVIGPATFTLALSGVTANTTITSAVFSFGTGPDTLLTAGAGAGGGSGSGQNVVPEPTSLMLLGSGLLWSATKLRRRS